MQVKYFYLEKKVAEHRFSALLQHNTCASSINPAHQVRIWSAAETKAGSKGTIPKNTVQNQSVPLSGNEALFPHLNYQS